MIKQLVYLLQERVEKPGGGTTPGACERVKTEGKARHDSVKLKNSQGGWGYKKGSGERGPYDSTRPEGTACCGGGASTTGFVDSPSSPRQNSSMRSSPAAGSSSVPVSRVSFRGEKDDGGKDEPSREILTSLFELKTFLM